ncbi:arsenical pump-driving ATPase [Roseococcus sp. SDR]|uniref:arsenical pump-driving ATPase n=1 Tax=Roseococcus sp. SDR TaxID=2835532 RepID=UPI001BD0AF4B|nr:arsenical pump-driving ATPase [Roseococcus sp. SDR]MBS7792667.1 arsenical pump-driving ATPase [Roseococcus sp. SDR]MBV1847981.1 arsenical pump-driving ATPase [Roseococcus sp. SDR]
MTLPGFLQAPPRHLFFTGKGGVGKTSVACAAAIALAEAGRRVLLVSTDPASNLDEMLGVALSDAPRPVPGMAGLSALNIDPEAAAEAYRLRVLDQMGGAPETERATVREQLSGACTIEVAAFDEFAAILAGDMAGFDHILFDTAPTGHTLRLLSLPAAWSGFLAANEAGASCLGPHSGLKMQERRFRAAMDALADASRTAIILVARPDRASLAEAGRSATELAALGLANQRLVVNGVFHAAGTDDRVGQAIERGARAALDGMPETLRRLPRDEVPLRGFDMVGFEALRTLLRPAAATPPTSSALVAAIRPEVPGLEALVEGLAARGHGLVMVMGKGGVGKTTIAAAVAIGLVARGHAVHLSTTDPAAHLSMTLGGEMPGLRVDRIDPRAETKRYVGRIMETRGRALDDAGRALLREDLRSPCTEEVAVFHAFSRVVAEARGGFVVLDTAPTGHTLLLMDATGAYHRQMTRSLDSAHAAGRVITPLMRLQDPEHTQVLIVTLPETTPVSEAAALQEDLRRARIEPHAWVVNRTLSGSGTRDRLLMQRMAAEQAQIRRIEKGLAQRLFLLPWQAEAPVGLDALRRLSTDGG